MQTGGESDPLGLETFESLDFDSLMLLCVHAAYLEYGALVTRVVGCLQGKYHDSLPPVNDIKTFASFVPSMFDHSVGFLAHEMVHPWACDYTAYTQYAAMDVTFSDKLEMAIQDLIAHRVEVGTKFYERNSNRHVQWSQQYYDNVAKVSGNSSKQSKKKPTVKLTVAVHAKTGTTPATEKKRRGRKTKKANEGSQQVAYVGIAEAAKKKRPTKDFDCYNCGKAGHLARNCKTKIDKSPQRAHRPALICYNCNEEGHLSRDCTVERPVVICYNCDNEGHLSRDCSEPRKADLRQHFANTCTARDTTGRNRNFRRAQRECVPYGIEVTGNGEGLRTCDREVCKGEVTRTGLVI